jgi:alpha-pyrone synthase
MTRVGLAAIATAHPSYRLSRTEWLRIADRISPPEVDRAVLARLAERSAIESRWCAAFEGDSSDGDGAFYRRGEMPGTAQRMQLWSRAAGAMSRAAATRALADASVEPGAVTHLVTASCTGFESPGIDARLIEALGIRRSVQRLNVGFMGCHAAVNALVAARNAVAADPGAVVLVVAVEVSSAHFHHSARLDRLVANTLFADGAAAIVVRAARRGDPCIAGTHATLIPQSHAEMAWQVGDHGFEMTLGAAVPDILHREVGAWVDAALATHDLTRAAVGGWAIHPGGPRVIDRVADALGLDEGQTAASRAILREYGNMSSATLPFILKRLAAEGVPLPWVGLAFGPGLVGEMIVVGDAAGA